MAEIKYTELAGYLKDMGAKQTTASFAPVYLIYGEELLYKTALNTLLDKIIPAGKRSLHYDPIDGTHNNIKDAIGRVNTFSLLSGTKVVGFCDSNVFYTKQDESKLIEKAKQAYDNKDIKNAARYLLNLMGILNLVFDDFQGENRGRVLKLGKDSLSDGSWIYKTVDYCLENGLSVPFHEDSAGVLQKAVKKGLPKGNHLIITTDLVDKRRALYKAIRQNGMIIDCSVPKGSRRADRMAQEAVLRERKKAILNRFGKTMDQSAYQAMCAMTGFDLRIFSHNLEKLVSYVGEGSTITVDDVRSVLKRTKKDPIYELTNAISDRNIQTSIFMINSLLAENLHPLQILAALTNQIRRLLMVKGFVESSHGSNWRAGVNYGYFKSNIMAAIGEYDRSLLEQIGSWESMVSKKPDTGEPSSTKKKKKKKRKPKTDLIIVKNPNNPYPVFQLLQSSERYTTDELVAALEYLSRADMQLKSTGLRPKLILERTVISICKGN